MKYQSHIDGLRAIAVLVVIFFHAGFSGFSGGYVGVDVFFVISGYLITALIYKQLCIGKFSVKSFYMKRIRRIFPALYVVILCTIPFAWYLLQAEAMADIEIRKYIFGKRSQSLQDLSKAINSMYYNEYIEHSTRSKESWVHSLDQVLSSFDSRVSRVDRIDLMMDKDQASCMIVDEGLTKHLYDYGHYTIAGARYFGRKVTEIVWLYQALSVKEYK